MGLPIIARTVSMLEHKATELGLDDVLCRQSGRIQETKDRKDKQPREVTRPFGPCNVKRGKS